MADPTGNEALASVRNARTHRVLLGGLLAVLFIASAWQMHQVNQFYPNHCDLADEWSGVRDLLHGLNPYSADGMRRTQLAYYGHALGANEAGADPQGFPYPAHLIFVLGPLGYLSLPAARLVYWIVVPPILALSLCLCIRWLNPCFSRRKMLLLTAFALVSWPVMWGLELQQPTLLIAAIVYAAIYFFSIERWVAAGVLFSLATVKPQLVVPLLLWLLLWAGLHRARRFIISFTASLLVLLAWTEHICPGWFRHWIGEVQSYGSNHGGPALAGLLGARLGVILTALLLCWMAMLLWRSRRCSIRDPEFGLSVAMALSAFVVSSPALWAVSYNQVMLFPACVLIVLARPCRTGSLLARKVAITLLLWGYADLLICVLLEPILHDFYPLFRASFLNPFLPVAVAVSLAFLAQERSAASETAGARDQQVSFSAPVTAKTRHTYDEAFYQYIRSGALRSARVVIPLLLRYFKVDSVLDIGSGAGAWLSVYRDCGVDHCLGIDGDYVLPSSLIIPPTDFLARDISQPFDLDHQFGLVQCLEVGEHIPTECSRTLVANLVRHGPCVLFSAATPGQGGKNHINEQPHEFWRALFAEQGYAPYDCVRPVLRRGQVEPWYRHNTLLYVSEAYHSRLPGAVAGTRIGEGCPIPEVSSRLYRLRSRILARLPVSSLTQIAAVKHRFMLYFRPADERWVTEN